MRGRAWNGRAEPRALLAAAAGLGMLAVTAAPIAAQSPGGTARTAGEVPQTPRATTTFENDRYGYAVALPDGCRQVKGPGTADAVCAPDFDPRRSAVVNAAGALVLSVAAEIVAGTAPGNGDATTIPGILQRHSEAAFKAGLPEAVCGESDKARVKIENVKQTAEDGHVVYSADVTCAAVKFLQIGKRRAAVRHVIGPGKIYRLMARAPVEDFQKQRATIDAFLASFRMLSSGRSEKQAGKAEP